MDDVTIKIPREKYQFLVKTVESHRGFIEKVGLNALIKQSLVRDIQIIKSILGINKSPS